MTSLVRKPKTRRGKRFLQNREPHIIENDKNALIIKGGKTTEIVTNILTDIFALKKPLAQQLKRKNPFHLFDDDTPLEKFSTKYDSSLFLFGSNSKKHPNSLIFGRMYDYHVLDMVELRVEDYKSAQEFPVQLFPFSNPGIFASEKYYLLTWTMKGMLGAKPCLVLQGTSFESDETMRRLGNLMIDWFRGPVVGKVRLQGLEIVISLTAVEKTLFFRVYKACLKKSGTTTPRIELLEIGPRITFSVQRTKLATDSLFKSALKQPKQLTVKKRKNMSTDVFGTKLGRIHVGKQSLDGFQTRKVKALRKSKQQETPMET
uniref:Ribosome production factor 2 homolog n=1 Tax=Syphacia muris TaxID=451379 RepID=A0A0N5ARI4_9BILA